MAYVLREQTFRSSIAERQGTSHLQPASMRSVREFTCNLPRYREKTTKPGKGGFARSHFAAQPSYRQRTDWCFAMRICDQKVSPWVTDRRLWFLVGKKILVFFPFMLLVHIWLASSFCNVQNSMQTLATDREELIASQKTLEINRDALLSPERVLMLAAEKYALHVPVKEQVRVFQ